MLPRPARALFLVALAAPTALAQGPAGYYASVNPSSPSTLRSTLHALIDDHVRVPYTASASDSG